MAWFCAALCPVFAPPLTGLYDVSGDGVDREGLIELPQLESGNVAPSAEGRTLFREKFLPLFSDSERQLGAFLVGRYAPETRMIFDIRQSTGLRRLVR